MHLMKCSYYTTVTMFKWLCIALASLLLQTGHSAKILAIFASYGYSQFFVGQPLLEHLAHRGHEITLVSAHRPKKQVENVEVINAPGVLRYDADINFYDILKMNILNNIRDTHAIYGVAECEELLKDPKVQNLIGSDRKFDLVLLEFWSGESLMAFANHFKAPLVVFCTTGASEWVNHLVLNPSPFSFVPHSFSGFGADMTLWERAQNIFLHVYFLYLKHFVLLPKHELLIKTYFPDPPAAIGDIIYNASLILLNSHPSVTPAYPLVSNMVEIGGFHINTEPLPEDIKTFLDDAKDGAIYFCMGSNLKSKDMGEDNIRDILKVFSGLKEKVLWKFEADELPDKPGNVAVRKWLPQRAVLAHPNVKLFISHCGQIGTLETVYFGKPLICIPIFVDQATNAAVSRHHGIATILNFNKLDEHTFRTAIIEMLNNKTYTENIQRRSRYFRENLVKPIDVATHWIEFVIKHRGAPHLRNPGLQLRWYEYYCIDVVGVALLVVLFVIYIVKGRLNGTKMRRVKRKRS